VVAGIGSGVRIAYVQLAGGALPVALSDTVRLLKTRQLLETSVAVAPCFDGDVQALTTASALAWAKAKGFDVVVCGIGPGIVGSGSALGHGGLAVSDAANATAALGGRAIAVVRYSGRDPRERHGGVSHHTRFGRHLYAIGGNREAAFYSGIDIERHIVGVFTLMGLMCGAAGIVLTARVGSATSDAGRMMELDAIAAAVIGGTSLLGGQGTVWGALLGALVMASLDNGMSLMNTEAFWQPIIKGLILVTAVGADLAARRK